MYYLLFLILFAFESTDTSSNNFFTYNLVKNVDGIVNKDTTLLKCHLNKKQTVSFYFADDFADTDPPFFLSSKDSIKKLLISSPTIIIDSYHQIPFLIYPGEKIDITVDSEGLPKLEIAGQKERNNEFDFFVQNLKQNKDFDLFMPDNVKFVADKNFDIEELIKSAKKVLNKREEFLKKFRQSCAVSENFAQYTKTLFKYLYIKQVLSPIEMQRMDINSLPGFYNNYVESLKSEFSCDSCLSNFGYRIAIGNMKEYILRNLKHNSKSFSLGFDTLAFSFTGLGRRYLLFLQLKENMQKIPAGYEKYLNTFLQEKNDIYSNYLAEKFNFLKKFDSTNHNKKELADIEGNRISWDSMLQKYKGKVLYIDFWASWCVPCRKLLPYSIKLQQEFQNKKVIFIFLSMDDDLLNWKKAVREEGITADRSYIIPNPKESIIVKRFKVNLIPRYMIIDKEGYIAEDNALTPDDHNIQKVLSNYLETKALHLTKEVFKKVQ